MNKTLKIILCVILVIVVAAGATAVWQWKNISLLYSANKNTKDDIQTQIKDSENENADKVADYLGDTLREFTHEEKKKIESGEISKLEVITEIITQESKKEEEPSKPTTQTPPANTTNKKTSDQYVKEAVSKLSEYQSGFASEIESLVAKKKREYWDILKEKKVKSDAESKAKIAAQIVSQASAIEKRCDQVINATLSELKTNLESIGADTWIVESMRQSANKQKSLKKAYYINLYMK